MKRAEVLRVVLVALIVFFAGSVYAQSTEICNDGKDNNGDGKIDCTDSFCNFAPTIEKGCNCFDTKDNDGDGKIDAADTDCATYYGLTFVGSGSTCSIQPPPGTGFTGIGAPQTTQQNTADTPAKVVVGDINGDGFPDAAVTSKWNSTIQVIATATASGFAPGDIMSDFRTPGSKIFPGSGSGYIFEYEIMIADIDKDKKAELFAIASFRGGSPNNAPTRYFLTGFKYAVKDLVPLFDAVDLGPDRPGNPGIADFDGDGKAEIYLKNRIYAAESGVLLADMGGDWDKQINSGPVAANITGDSKLELICGNFIYNVPSLSGRTLTPLTLFADMNTLGGPKFFPKGFNDLTEYGKDQASSTSTADFDGDGFLDVLMTGAINCSGLEASPCGNNVTTIFYWNVKKGTVSTFAPPDTSTPDANGWVWGTGRINLGDANGDGKLEALFIAGNQLYCLGKDGSGNLTQLWVHTINDSKSGILSLTIYDFDNNGRPEVVYRDSQELRMIDGVTGQNGLNGDPSVTFSRSCQSHTWTEGPIVADVNGDGGTDICVTCYTNNSFNINSDIQQQSLGQTRLYYSSTNGWLPTRKVWNQHPYYVTNIKDDLTLPFPQVDPSLIFSNAPCPNGLPGPQRPLNLFMNQVPRLSKDGCPEFPAPDLTFTGDTPSPTGVDTDGDGVYNPTVVVTPPICGNLDITAYFNIINNGDLPITDNVPVSFYNGDPTANPVVATFLAKTSIQITNLQVGQKLVSAPFTFPGPGTTFKLFIVLYNDGTKPLPLSLAGQSTKECSISNNVYSIDVIPSPVTATIEKISDNFKCINSAPDNGELRAHLFKGATEVTDFSAYTFQWYTGSGTASPIPAPAGTDYNLSGRAEGTYTLVVTDKIKGCSSIPVEQAIVRLGNDPVITINVISNQTVCSPPNGKLDAVITGGNTGFTFAWFDFPGLTPLGITGPTASGLVAGSYVVSVTKDGCTKTSAPATVNGPQYPDAIAQVLLNVVDCSNLNSGSVQVDASINGVVQNPASYTFNWYFYNNITATQGSILPVANGTGPVRTGLAAGFYIAEVKDNLTQCTSPIKPIVEVKKLTVVPTIQITRLAPQTSCDLANPNGILKADALVGGVIQDPSTITFKWFKGQTTLPADQVPAANISGTNGQIVNKVAGGGIPYTVKITTQLNCSATADSTVAENINVPVVTLTSSPNFVCDVTKAMTPYNGSVQATVTFAGNPVTLPDPNYTFSWYDGTTTATPHNPATSQSQTLTGLKDGNYAAIVTRTDLFCPSVPKTIPVAKATVLPLLNPSSTGSNNCDPTSTPDGTVTVAVGNAIAGDVFSYQWYSGNAVIAGNKLTDAPINHNSTASTAINVGGPAPVGSPIQYTVEVLNKTTGCINNVTQFVADNSVVPVLSTITGPNSICSPSTNFNGSMTVSVTNIPSLYTIADYTFKWYDGNTIASPHSPQPTPTSTVTLSKLDVGMYSVIGENTKTGCISAIATNSVANSKVLPTLAPSSKGSNNCIIDVANGIVNDGTATVAASGTPGPYSYQWYTGNGDPISGGLPLIAGATASTLNGVGGPNIPVGSAPHFYTTLVKDISTGCSNYTTAAVADLSSSPVLATTTAPNSICSPITNFNGSVTVSVTNIPALYTIADYEFIWYDGNTTGLPHTPQPTPASVVVLPKLDAGTYSVIGTNTKTGCFSALTTDQVADKKVYPAIQVATTGSHNCDPGKTPDGTATATITNTAVVNGAGPFTYLWTPAGLASPISIATNNANQATAIKLGGPANAPNMYNVMVTNTATNCVSNSSGLVADVSAKPTLTLLPFKNTVCDNTLITVGAQEYNGHVDVNSVTNNTGTYSGGVTLSYSWFDVDPITSALTANVTSPTNTSTSTSLTLLDNAKYAAQVTIDELGCTSDPVIAEVLDNLTIPAITPSIVNNTNCPGGSINANGSAAVTSVSEAGVGAALTNYTYAWYDGAIVDPLNLRAENSEVGPVEIQGPTTFTVEVINKANGCKGNEPMTVTDVKVIPGIALTLVKNNTNCIGTGNGEIAATLTDPGASYAITWFPLTGVSVADNYTLLAADTYTASVKNTVTGCKSTDDTKDVLDNFTYPAINIAVTPQTSCDVSAPNGKLTATSTITIGSIASTIWYDGFTVSPGGTQSISQSLGVLSNLKKDDDYTVEVIATSTGCSSTKSGSVNEVITPPVVNITIGSPVTRCDTPNGSATATITDLTGPTDYNIYYVFTSAVSGASFPTTAATIISTATVPDTRLNQTVIPTAYSNSLIPGYLSAVVIDNNTTCESNPVTKQISDNTSKTTVQVTLVPSPGSCGGGFGGIDVTTVTTTPVLNPNTGNPWVYNYEWYSGASTNSGPFNFVVGSGQLLPVFSPVAQKYGDNRQDLGMPGGDNTISAGTYSLVIKTDDGCGNVFTDIVPTTSKPQIAIVPTDITSCATDNGQLRITISNTTANTTGYTAKVYPGSNSSGASFHTEALGTTGGAFDAAVAPTLSPGSYFVELVDNDFPGCPMGKNQDLKTLVLPPVVSIGTISANTSCDPTASSSGSVAITVNDDSADKYTSTLALNKNYRITNINPSTPSTLVPAAGAWPFQIGTGFSGQSTTVSGMAPVLYQITVTDQPSSCALTFDVTIPDQQALPDDLDKAITDETFCVGLSNGAAIASILNSGDVTEFKFKWSLANDLSAPIINDIVGGGATDGEVASFAQVGGSWPVGATAGEGHGDRILYVQATKNVAPGFGCKTTILQVVIPDKHVAPDMTLTPAFDSFCAATAGNNAIGDGKITIIADADPSTGVQDMPVAGFDYFWDVNPLGASPTPTDNSNIAAYIIDELHDGTYNLTVTNADTKCHVKNSATIDPAPYVIAVDLTDVITDQRICNNDGWVRIKQISLKDNSVGSPKSQTTADAAIDPLYTFQWYPDATLTAGAELRENAGVTPLIATRTLSNDSDQDFTTNEAGDYQAMKAGTYYVIATRNDNTKIGFGCPSLPFRVDVQDIHTNPVPDLTVLSNTSCFPAGPGEGEIIIKVADATAAPFNGGTYTYTWIAPGPMPANPPATNLNPGSGNGDGSGADDHYTELLDNVTLGNLNPYTVTIENIKTGCKVNASATIVKNATPVFVQAVTVFDQVLCSLLPDGSMTVDKVSLNDRLNASQDFTIALPGSGTTMLTDFQFEWTRVGDVNNHVEIMNGAAAPFGSTLNAANYDAGFAPAFGAGTYTVTARRKNGSPGAGCPSAPYEVVIQDKRINPVVTLTPFSNTSCNGSVLEGEITLKVSDATTATPPAGGFKFDYNWTTVASPVSASPSTGNNGNQINDGAGTDRDYETGLLEGDYTVEVTNATTLCKTTNSTTILQNATPVFVQAVTVLDQILCLPDGSITVDKVSLNDRLNTPLDFTATLPGAGTTMLTDFQFEWTRVGDVNNYIEIMNGAAAPFGSTLNAGNYDNVTGFAPAFGAGTYTVTARRKNGSPGAGCPSAPYQVEIQNKQVFPVVSMTPLANTSCTSDPLLGEGEIKVTVADASPATGPFAFTYLWDNTDPATTDILTLALGANDGDSFGGGEPEGGIVGNPPDNDEDHPKGLFHGVYKIMVRNNQTQCPSTGVTEIYQNSTPVFTAEVFPTPQITCNPSDAKLEVTKVTVTDRDNNNQTAPLGNFDYDWSSGTIANIVKTTQGANGQVSGGTILDSNPVTGYSAIANGIYYVVSRRVSGAPGIGCASAPYKVDIDDQRVYPTVAFTSVANSSCSILMPNGTVVAIASELIPPAIPDTYSFTWTLDSPYDASGPLPLPGAVSPTSVRADTPPDQSTITKALDGTYVTTALNSRTGCSFDASFNLILDQTRSTPNVIDVDTIDPLDCNPSAQAEVTKITLGTNNNSLLIPPAGTNVIDQSSVSPALTDFNYQWYKGTTNAADQLAIGGPAITAPCIGPNCPTPTVGLSAGTYYVFVKDPTTDCISGPKEVVITDDDIVYPEAEIKQTIKQISCIATIGTAELAATGDGQNGVPYTFTWFNTLDNTGPAINVASAPTISNLLVGNYSVTVLNTVTGCTDQALYIIPDEAPLYKPEALINTQPRTLCVGQDGAVSARVFTIENYPPAGSGFLQDYTADLYFGSSPDLASAPNVPNMSKYAGELDKFITSSLAEGFYTVRITDNNTGCTGVATGEIEDKRTPPVIVIVEDNPMTNCDPIIANGQLSATADGGKVGGYTFEWYSGNAVTTPPGALIVSSNKLVGQLAGTYVVHVTMKLTGCIADQSGIITDKTVIPFAPAASVVQHRTNCINPNGWVTASVGVDVLHYDFNWYDGNAVKSATDFIGIDYMDVDIGPYTVTATDIITGCVSPPAVAVVEDHRIIPQFTFETVPSYCADTGKPKGIGSVQLNLTNANEAFIQDVQWREVTTNNIVGAGIQIFELFPGLYQAEAITTEGCTNEGIAEVKTEINPYNGVSSNGDAQNDNFIIDCISNFPNNNVKIFNRSGILVYEIDGYNNADFSFKGYGEDGVYFQGKELPVGTYFYIIDKRDGSKPVAGYLELDR